MSAPDYADNAQNGWCGDPRRGASMGRHDQHAALDSAPRLYLRRVPIDAGGYDKLGTYWGTGAPLFWYANGGEIDAMTRGRDRTDAKRQIRARYQGATFYR